MKHIWELWKEQELKQWMEEKSMQENILSSVWMKEWKNGC